MDSQTLREMMTAYAAIYNEDLKEEIYQDNIEEQSSFTWNPNKNVIAAKGGKLGIMDKGDPKSWREPSELEKGEIPLSSTAAFRKSKAGQKFIQQKDAAKKASSTTPTAAAKPTASATPAAKQSTTPTATTTAKPKPTASATPAAKPTKIQQDVADLRRMQAASMMRQQNRNLPSGKIPTGDDLKPSTSASAPSTQTSTSKPTPTAPVNKARGSSKPGSIVSGFDLFDVVKGYLLGEGYADTEEAALAIMANMSEGWTESILEMNDFAAGGGAAKMKATGMTKDQVVALGKKNLASKPASSSPSSSGKSTGSTPSDAVRDRLASTEKYRQGVFKIPSKAERVKSAQDQEAKFDAYQKKQRESGYYKTGYKDLPGTFEKG